MSEPKWMQLARADLGLREISGSRDNPKVVQFFRDVKHSEIRDDETSWCAAFVGSCLERSGHVSTRNLTARSYKSWGKETEPKVGAITVLWRVSRSDWRGHVGFFVKQTSKYVYLLGGNQGNEVSIKPFPKSRVLAYRWPADVQEETTTDQWENAKQAVQYNAEDLQLTDFANYIGIRLTQQNIPIVRAARNAADKATISSVLWQYYWAPIHCNDLPEPIAIFTYDTATNVGSNAAAHMLQRSLGVEDDGDVGPDTIAAARNADPREIITKMRQERIAHLKQLDDWDLKIGNLNAWMDALEAAVLMN